MDHEDFDEGTARKGSVGRQLLRAREAAGLSRADVAAQTKIAERHLQSIEEDRFGDLAGRTYAMGFTRAYARAVDLDADPLVERVRAELDASDYHRPTPTPTFEPGDPARVPPLRIALLAAVVLVAVAGAIWYFAGDRFSPAGDLPELTEGVPATAQAGQPTGARQASVAAEAPVTITAIQPDIWVRVSNGEGERLFEKLMSLEESYTVPPGTEGAILRTGRPDALSLSVGGRDLPPLADGPALLGDIALDPEALRRRSAGEATPSL